MRSYIFTQRGRKLLLRYLQGEAEELTASRPQAPIFGGGTLFQIGFQRARTGPSRTSPRLYLRNTVFFTVED